MSGSPPSEVQGPPPPPSICYLFRTPVSLQSIIVAFLPLGSLVALTNTTKKCQQLMRQWVASGGARWDVTSYSNQVSPFIFLRDRFRYRITIPDVGYWSQMANFFARMLLIRQKGAAAIGYNTSNKAIRRIIVPVPPSPPMSWEKEEEGTDGGGASRSLLMVMLMPPSASFLSMPRLGSYFMAMLSNVASHSLHTLQIGQICSYDIAPLVNSLHCCFPSLHTLAFTLQSADGIHNNEFPATLKPLPTPVTSVKRLFFNANPSRFRWRIGIQSWCDILAHCFPNVQVLGISFPPLNEYVPSIYKSHAPSIHNPYNVGVFGSLLQLHAIQTMTPATCNVDLFKAISTSFNIIPFVEVPEACSVNYRIDAFVGLVDPKTVIELHNAFLKSPALRNVPRLPGVSRQVDMRWWVSKIGTPSPHLLALDSCSSPTPKHWTVSTMSTMPLVNRPCSSLPSSSSSSSLHTPAISPLPYPHPEYLGLAREVETIDTPTIGQLITDHHLWSHDIDMFRWHHFLAGDGAFIPSCDLDMAQHFIIAA